MSIPGYSVATLDEFVGKELGVSDWVTIDQARIDAFAQCTGDNQWIHVDMERAARESPFGGTIADGYLTLSYLRISSDPVLKILAWSPRYRTRRLQSVSGASDAGII
ncbi:acyl dehydratase [Paraburkholderia sp. GAS42]